MKTLEARALIEATGNYEEDEIDDIMEIYEDVYKHIGFVDNRRDSRFIVKFHDIFYYMPDGLYKEYSDTIDALFNDFCWWQYDELKEDLRKQNIDVEEMLTRYTVGSYQAFKIDIPEITEENATEVAMKIWDEFNGYGHKYAHDYVYVVEALQNMEDYYMESWIEYLDGSDIPNEYIEQIKQMYKKGMERRQAAQTLAK